MRKLTALLLMLSLFLPTARADDVLLVEPGPQDVRRTDAKSMAIDFFAGKCDLPPVILDSGSWSLSFGYFDGADAPPVWVISAHGIPKHPGDHVLRLSRDGQVLRWMAHGALYTDENPALLDGAVAAEPLPTDATAEDACRLILAELSARELDAPDEATLHPHFVLSTHFDGGSIPLWLAEFEVDGEMWKAAVSYNGQLLSMVKQEQDFTCYTTPGEDFLAGTLSGEEHSQAVVWLNELLYTGDATHEERVAAADWLRPKLQAWIETHPYYMNAPGLEYDALLKQTYGVPDETVLSEAEAVELAYAAALPEEAQHRDARRVICRYFVTDPEHPTWEITIGRGLKLPKDTKRSIPQAMDRFFVTIDARTGAVLALTQD